MGGDAPLWPPVGQPQDAGKDKTAPAPPPSPSLEEAMDVWRRIQKNRPVTAPIRENPAAAPVEEHSLAVPVAAEKGKTDEAQAQTKLAVRERGEFPDAPPEGSLNSFTYMFRSKAEFERNQNLLFEYDPERAHRRQSSYQWDGAAGRVFGPLAGLIIGGTIGQRFGLYGALAGSLAGIIGGGILGGKFGESVGVYDADSQIVRHRHLLKQGEAALNPFSYVLHSQDMVDWQDILEDKNPALAEARGMGMDLGFVAGTVGGAYAGAKIGARFGEKFAIAGAAIGGISGFFVGRSVGCWAGNSIYNMGHTK